MSNNQDNKAAMIKTVGVVILGIIVLALFYNVFFGPGPMNYGSSTGMDMMHGGGYTGYNNFGFSIGSLLAGILMILIKILSIILVVSLVVGIWVIIKDYLLNDGQDFTSSFASISRGLGFSAINCPKCGSKVNDKWDFCPDCGQVLIKPNKVTTDK